MDSARFDAMTRSISVGMTRQGFTRLLGSLALGGLLRPLSQRRQEAWQPQEGRERQEGRREANAKHGKRTVTGERHQGRRYSIRRKNPISLSAIRWHSVTSKPSSTSINQMCHRHSLITGMWMN